MIDPQILTIFISLIINFITVYSFFNNKEVTSNTRLIVLEEEVKHLKFTYEKIDKQNEIMVNMQKEIILINEKLENLTEQMKGNYHEK